MDSEPPRCGKTTTSGEPCKRPAGWGRDGDSGPCVTHHETANTSSGRPASRPSKLTHDRQERIAADLEAGIPVTHAAPANGITETTFYEWVNRGEQQEEGLYADFSERVTRARAHGKGDLLRSAIEIARESDDPRTLLRAYQEITGGERAHEGDDTGGGLQLVVPEIARRGESEE